MDKVPVRAIIFAANVLLGIGTAAMLYIGSVALIDVGAFIYGVGFGASPISRVIWSNYYGRKLQGSIQGIVMPFSMVATMSGPLVGGLLYDAFGNYKAA